MSFASSRLAARQVSRVWRHSTRRSFTGHARQAASRSSSTLATTAVLGTALTMAVLLNDRYPSVTFNAAVVPLSGDVLSMGTPTKESQTGILFPQLCNAMNLAGVGVRIKYIFVKVYAVGTYLDPVAMMAVKKGSNAEIEKALLNPDYPRTIRIVMNRGLSIDKYTAAIVESVEPRLNGQDLETYVYRCSSVSFCRSQLQNMLTLIALRCFDSLEEFKKLNPPVDLVEGAEIEMTIRGDTLLYKNAVGGVGSLKSRRFCEAMCDVYYGEDPVSPTHKESVLEGVRNL